jgi:hypothetical protein
MRAVKSLTSDDSDFTWMNAVIQSLHYFGSSEPHHDHIALARELLQEIKISDEATNDFLARELCKEFQKLRKFILDRFKSIDNPSSSSLPLDIALIEFLERRPGSWSKEMAFGIRESAPFRYQKYRESGYSPLYRKEVWSLWISFESSSPSFPYAKLIAQVVWRDDGQKAIGRVQKNVPALTQGIFVPLIKPYLCSGIQVKIMDDNKIICLAKDGALLSSIPCFDLKLLSVIQNGLEDFSTLSGHKLLRWQVQMGFLNWLSGVDDPRLISTAGGYAGIAKLVGCGGGPSSRKLIRNILYAQAYCQFDFPQIGKGNMIVLREIEKHRNGEPSKINIILGEFLLPNYTHRLPPGEKRRLIPITGLPPLIGSKNTHAAQAMLQLLVLEEFSNQSDFLAKERYIVISQWTWNRLADEAKLPLSCLNKVISGWTQDDPAFKAFLQKNGDQYALGADYYKATDFLETQGKQRIAGAIKGTKAVSRKKSMS